jgi:hypothetical protein
MVEATFQIDNKGNNVLLKDRRALAIRISNLLTNRKTGLPNNSDVFFDTKSYSSEYGNSSGIAIFKQQLQNAIKNYIVTDSAVTVDIAYTSDNNTNELRKGLAINITIGESSDAYTISFGATPNSDGLTFTSVNLG